jgi:hypothetical protein
MSIANVVALNEVVSQHETAPLDEVANAINIKLRLADKSDNTANNHRLAAGQMLVALRTRVEADGLNWWKWAAERFDRSRKDIAKVMALANADDPEAAVETERTKAREGMARSRKARGANVSATQLVEHVLALVERMEDDQRQEFITKLKEKYPW